MAQYKPYPKYKESNIPWPGDTSTSLSAGIPVHWKPTYIKGITKTYSEKGKPELEMLSVYRDYGVIKKSSRDDNHNKPGIDLSSYKVVHQNTLVLNKMKTWSGSLGVSNYLGIVSPAYITCKSDLEQVETKYLNYLLRCKNYVFEYNRLSYGVRPSQWDMRYQDFKSIPIFLPPKQEQTAIARFLDYKLAKINRFIQNKKQLLALYAKRRKSLTRELVNSQNVKYLRLSSVANLIQRPIERLENELYTPVGLYNRGRGLFHKESTLGKELGDYSFFYIKKGDVILSDQFAWEGSVALVDLEDDGCVASHRYPVLNCDLNVIIPEYLFFIFYNF
jgi:type I restriction enzyme, S subunit